MAQGAFAEKVDAYFHISSRGSTIQNEIKGGVITFLAMVYILVVNPLILNDPAIAQGYTRDALFTSTALAAFISCILMGLYSRFPVAIAPGMGVNAFLATTICGVMGFTFVQGLMVVLISGIVFLALTGYRKRLIDEMPQSIKFAISAGIGFFVTVIGLTNAKIVVPSGSSLVLGPIGDIGVFLGIICIVITLALWHRKWWGAVITGMVATLIIGLIFAACGLTSSTGLIPAFPESIVPKLDFSLVLAVFTDFQMFDVEKLIVPFVIAIVSLLVVDMFDTAGTLIGVGTAAGMVDENGHITNSERAFTVDAAATVIGATVGTSTTTSFIESTTGIGAGARTGLMAVVVGLLFALSLVFQPVFGMFTSACTVGALVIVGIMMIQSIKDIDWNDPVNCAMAFTTIFMMGLTGSITDGIAFGIFVYCGGMAMTGKAKEVPRLIWALAVIFFVYFFIQYAAIPYGWI